MPFVVDDHGDARVAFAVAGLVHADRREAAERRRHRRFQPFGDPMGGVFRRRATRRAENRLRSSGSRRSSATRVPIRNRVWTGCPARPTARKRPRRRTPPPWSCPRRLLPHREHRSIPARGRTRISSTGSERGGESVIRTSSATMPLTFGNPANKLLLRRSSRFISLAGKQNTREHPSRSRNQRLDDEPTSTKTAIAPYFAIWKIHC